MRINLNFLISLFFLTITNVSANVVLDSVAEFSDTQGENGWSYGYYDGDSDPFSPGDFEELDNFQDSRWSLQDRAPGHGLWTFLWNTGGHPTGISGEQWAVRRWVSDVDGSLSLQGHLSDERSITNGVNTLAHIFVDGNEVLSENLELGAIDYSLIVAIHSGSIIDFAIDPNGGDAEDSTHFTAIGTLSSVPVPAAVWFYGTGLIGLMGMKRKYTSPHI